MNLQEIAEQLKEAGYVWPDTGQPMPPHIETLPDLSELIKACGRRFASLESTPGGFQASGYGATRMQIVDGKTPEQAVARLLLALQKAA
jgi:hypothetical protein